MRGFPDAGSAALELAVGVFAWAAGLLLVASAYQLLGSRDDVAHAAGAAARAAAMAPTVREAAEAARVTAERRLAIGPCERGSVTVRVDGRDFRAGGTIQVDVSCRTDPLLGGTRTVTATADEVLDRYRGGL
jgi:hypothetical protein